MSIEKPKELTNKHLVYWAEKEGLLVGSQKGKAMKLIELNLVKKTESGYDILPIEGYNKTTHKIRNGKCSCQAATRTGIECSHEMAVKLLEFKEKWNGS